VFGGYDIYDIYLFYGMISKKGYKIEQLKAYPITYGLIIINTIIFLVPFFFDISPEDLFEVGAIYGPDIVLHKQIWRLFTAMFLHGGIEHIAMNMLSLWFIGRVAEVWLGGVSYIGIYFISGLMGGLASIYMHPVTVGVGASGAIFGVFGALAGMVMVHRKKMEAQFKAFMKEFGVILLLNLGIGIAFESVDLTAHIAGLVMGIFGGAMVAKSRKLIWLYILISFMIMIPFYNHLYTLYVSILNAQF